MFRNTVPDRAWVKARLLPAGSRADRSLPYRPSGRYSGSRLPSNRFRQYLAGKSGFFLNSFKSLKGAIEDARFHPPSNELAGQTGCPQRWKKQLIRRFGPEVRINQSNPWHGRKAILYLDVSKWVLAVVAILLVGKDNSNWCYHAIVGFIIYGFVHF